MPVLLYLPCHTLLSKLDDLSLFVPLSYSYCPTSVLHTDQSNDA
jgi:hypothetical protein